MKRKLLLSLVISITILLAGGFVLFFLSCTGAGGGGGEPEIGTLYIGGYVPGAPGKGYIYVVGAGTKDLITTIEIPVDGAKPDWLTLSPDGKKLYCSDQNSSYVYIIDTQTNSYEKSTYVYTNPKGIAFTPDGTTALVGCIGEVCMIDVATGTHDTLNGYLFTSGQVGGIGVHPKYPSINRLYAVLEQIGGDGYIGVSEITGGLTLTQSQMTWSEAVIDLAINSEGSKLYISADSNNFIVLCNIDPAGDVAFDNAAYHIDSLPMFERMAITPDGSKLYIVRMGESKIDKLITSDTTYETIDYGGPDNETIDIALSDDGATVFVLVQYPIGIDSINGGRVVFINAADGSVAGTIDVGTFDPISIAYKKP